MGLIDSMATHVMDAEQILEYSNLFNNSVKLIHAVCMVAAWLAFVVLPLDT
jgi:hypothetical protein